MARLEARALELEGYGVICAGNGCDALSVFESADPDLVLLDLMMPGLDGYEVCRRIREFSQVPVIIVTVKGAGEEKLKGFALGADDYVTKPFDPKELTARVRAVLRRTRVAQESSRATFRCSDLIVDFVRRTVTVAGKQMVFTGTEYAVLSYLAQNAGYILTANEILSNVWGESYEDDIGLVQAYVSRLRRKLGDDARNPKYILTRPGIGYSMRKE